MNPHNAHPHNSQESLSTYLQRASTFSIEQNTISETQNVTYGDLLFNGNSQNLCQEFQ
jgi:hypothetical protein